MMKISMLRFKSEGQATLQMEFSGGYFLDLTKNAGAPGQQRRKN
jgi:hypothetical protein